MQQCSVKPRRGDGTFHVNDAETLRGDPRTSGTIASGWDFSRATDETVRGSADGLIHTSADTLLARDAGSQAESVDDGVDRTGTLKTHRVALHDQAEAVRALCAPALRLHACSPLLHGIAVLMRLCKD